MVFKVPLTDSYMLAVPVLNVQHTISLQSHQSKLNLSTSPPLYTDALSTDIEYNSITKEAEQKSGFKKFLAMVKPKPSKYVSLKNEPQ